MPTGAPLTNACPRHHTGEVDAIDSFGSLRALRPPLDAAGLAVVSAEASREASDALTAHYAGAWHQGTLWSDALWEACQEAVRGAVVLARGPTVRLSQGIDAQGLVLAHPERPEELLVAPSAEFPAALFLRVPAEARALREALASLDPSAPRARTKTARALMGYSSTLTVPSPYSGELEPAGPHELDRHFNSSPAATSWCWGTAYDDDPIDPAAARHPAAMVVTRRKIRAQLDGALPTLTRATLFSRSHLGVEMHRGGLYAWRIAYAPSPRSRDTLARFNERTGYGLPDDLPVDVAAAAHGFDWIDAAWIDAQLSDEADMTRAMGLLRMAFALAFDDLGRAAERLRRHGDRPERQMRATALDAALDYNWQWFLEERACVERDADLRDVALAAIAVGVAPPIVNDMGEPLDVYGDHGAEGADGDGFDADDEQGEDA